jgi:hypothetical protein
MAESEDIKELRKELKKLKPEARLKKLKELEEKRKAEITDIEVLIKDSEKDIKTDAVAEEIAPEQTEINIGKLFEEESARLEGTVKKEAPETEKEDLGYISFKQAYNDYSTLQDIGYASMTGSLTSEQIKSVSKIEDRLANSKYQSTSQEVANILVASKSVAYNIRKYSGRE